MMTKLVIYTVLTGSKELLGNPLEKIETCNTDLDVDFICFTDDHNLKSNTWHCRVFDTHSLPPEKSSRRPKTLPHEYLSRYEYSLYIDNICELKRLPNSTDILKARDERYVYRLFKHSTRHQLAEESLAVASLGYESSDKLIEQLDTYASLIPLQDISPLSTCTVLLREHNNPEVIRHGAIWWEHILQFSKRDQMSFDFCRKYTNLSISYFDGTKFDNDLIHHHSNVHPGRRLANIDNKYFTRSLKAICDEQGKEIPSAEDVLQANNLARTLDSSLDILFYLSNSGFGSYHYPRFNAAGRLAELLRPYCGETVQLISVYCAAEVMGHLTNGIYRSSTAAIQAFIGSMECTYVSGIVDALTVLKQSPSSRQKILVLVYNSAVSKIDELNTLSDILFGRDLENGLLLLNSDGRSLELRHCENTLATN